MSITFGTYQLSDKTFSSVLSALHSGYRSIDTAWKYRNEQMVIDAVKEFIEKGNDRDDIYITTKIWTFSPEMLMERIELFKQIDRVDRILLHRPTKSFLNDWNQLNLLIEKEGLDVELGVSNFDVKHLSVLFENSPFTPQYNQIEISPYLHRKELISYCQQHNISVSAYSPLVQGKKFNVVPMFNDLSPAQILLAWSCQNGYNPIPRSCNVKHIKENLEHHRLSDETMGFLNGINERFAVCPQYLV